MTITCVFIMMIATDGAFFHWEGKDSAWYWALIRDSIGGCLGPHLLFDVVMILGGPQFCLCNIVFFTCIEFSKASRGPKKSGLEV